MKVFRVMIECFIDVYANSEEEAIEKALDLIEEDSCIVWEIEELE